MWFIRCCTCCWSIIPINYKTLVTTVHFSTFDEVNKFLWPLTPWAAGSLPLSSRLPSGPAANQREDKLMMHRLLSPRLRGHGHVTTKQDVDKTSSWWAGLVCFRLIILWHIAAKHCGGWERWLNGGRFSDGDGGDDGDKACSLLMMSLRAPPCTVFGSAPLCLSQWLLTWFIFFSSWC